MHVDTTLGVSVVICCYDSAERLPMTLLHLAKQAVPASIPWEVIVVDNASPDASVDVARQSWSDSGCRVPLRVVAQSIPGVSAARDKGYEAARYEFILYCDDDNWLGPDYVRRVFELMVEHPAVGAVGGQGRAVGEAALPDWFASYARYFAVGPQNCAPGAIEDAKGYLYGAGLAIRRSALARIKQLGVRGRLSDRTPGTLTSGGDVELSYLLRLSGYDLWFDPRLEFVHFMPPRRLVWTYFLALVEGTHRSCPYLHAYRRALRGEAEGVGSAQWMVECWKIAWRALRSPVTLLEALFSREGSHASYLWHRWRGDWAGWQTVRSDYGALCRELVALRRSLENRAAAGSQAKAPCAGARPGPQDGGELVWSAVVDPMAAFVADPRGSR